MSSACDYPEECIPRTPDDVFYEDEEEKEGGIYEKTVEYGEEMVSNTQTADRPLQSLC